MGLDRVWLPILKTSLKVDCAALHNLIAEESDLELDPGVLVVNLTKLGTDPETVPMRISFTTKELRIRIAVYVVETTRVRDKNSTFSSLLLCANRLSGDDMHGPMGALRVVASGSDPCCISVLNEYTLPLVPVDSSQQTIQELLTKIITSLFWQTLRYKKCFAHMVTPSDSELH